MYTEQAKCRDTDWQLLPTLLLYACAVGLNMFVLLFRIVTPCKLEATGGTVRRAKAYQILLNPWAARYNTWLLIKLTPKGVVFSFLHNSHD